MRKSLLVRVLLNLLILASFDLPHYGQSFARAPLHKCWNLETETLRDTGLASDNENSLFLPLISGTVKAVELQTGRIIWQTELGGDILGELHYDEGKIYVVSARGSSATDRNLSISQLNSATGITQWKKEFAANTKASAAYILTGGKNADTFCVVTDSGQIYLVDKKSGKTIFSKSLDAKITSPPALKDDQIYIGTNDNRILSIALSGKSGVSEITRLSYLPTIIVSGKSAGNSALYIGNDFGEVFCLNTQTKKIDWKLRTGGAITDITEFGDRLIVSSADNYVYLLSARNGNRSWKKRLTGKNYGSTPTDSEVAVFSPLGDRSATFVELRKGKTINQITLDGNDENFFVNSPLIMDDKIIFSTLQGFYAFSAEVCK